MLLLLSVVENNLLSIGEHDHSPPRTQSPVHLSTVQMAVGSRTDAKYGRGIVVRGRSGEWRREWTMGRA